MENSSDRERQSRLTRLISGSETTGIGKIISMAVSLSVPSIMAQLAVTAMEYIDATMVGHLGANAAASIGLVTTTTWLFMGLCSAAAMGFSVQIAHLLGAREVSKAKSITRQAYMVNIIYSVVIALIGIGISPYLPGWLGGTQAINPNASKYFLIFALSIPLMQCNFLTNGLLRCSGNMIVPGIMGVVMCVLDVVFNFFLIFPTREVGLGATVVTIPGFGLGVWGAALGTAIAEGCVTIILLFYLFYGKSELRLAGFKSDFKPNFSTIRRAFKIGFPMGLERFINSAAQITLTIIVAPLGAAAIAANAFAITVEGLCYMPGFGISDAATTLTGQSLGAGKFGLAKRFAWTTTSMGMVIMGVMGVLMYLAAPFLIGIMSNDRQIVELGVMALRIEAWAEPMYAASIVAYGVCVGAGDTLWPSVMNLGSMWGVRITLAAVLAPVMGLKGVWLAMCIELCFRGFIFLWRLKSDSWMKAFKKLNASKLKEEKVLNKVN